MELKLFIRRLEKEKLKLVGTGDSLREILDELEMHIDSNDRAVEALGCAIEALSELV